MKKTLTYLLTQIVDHPDDIKVTETVLDSQTVLNIKVHDEDMGKIIGKHGRIIRAIRDVMKVLAMKRNTYLDITLEENRENAKDKTNANLQVEEP